MEEGRETEIGQREIEKGRERGRVRETRVEKWRKGIIEGT